MNKYLFFKMSIEYLKHIWKKSFFIAFNFFYVENEIDSSSNWYNYVGEFHKDSFFFVAVVQSTVPKYCQIVGIQRLF